MKNILTPIAESVFILLRLKAVASPTNAAIQKKIFRIKNDYAYNLR